MPVQRTKVVGRRGAAKQVAIPPADVDNIASDVGIKNEIPVVMPNKALPEDIDAFLEGKLERLRGESAMVPHLTLVIGDRAVRAVKFDGEWLVEAMARRAFMFSDVHNIAWRERTNIADLGFEVTVADTTVVIPAGMNAVSGPSGGGKTILMNMVHDACSTKNIKSSYINVGEPVPESNTDISVILHAICRAVITGTKTVLLFDSFKGPLFTTPGSSGKGGVARSFFQDISNLSSILARYEVAAIGAINFQSTDQAVVTEVTEALIGNTVGVFNVLATSSANSDAISYAFFQRNYINGDRGRKNFTLVKSAYKDRQAERTAVGEGEVFEAVAAAFTTAPNLETSEVTARRITRSLIKPRNTN